MKEKERERNRERERGNKHHQEWAHSSRALLVTVYNTRTDEFSKTFCEATAPVWHTGTLPFGTRAPGTTLDATTQAQLARRRKSERGAQTCVPPAL